MRTWCHRNLHLPPAKGAGQTEKIAVNIHFPMVWRYTQVDVCLRESGVMCLIPDDPGRCGVDVMAVDHNRTIGIVNMQMVTMGMIGPVVAADVYLTAYAAVITMMARPVIRLVDLIPCRFVLTNAVAVP